MVRWKLQGGGGAEDAERARLRGLMDAWWAAFAERSTDIADVFERRGTFDLPAFMDATLHAVDQRLCWEFGSATTGEGHRLCITPEADRNLRPLLDELLSRAPALPGWEFHAYRSNDPAELVLDVVEARCGIRPDTARVRMERSDERRMVDVTWELGPEIPEEKLGHVAFVLTETTFGEEMLDRWVGAVEHQRVAKGIFSRGPKWRGLKLEEARPALDTEVRRLLQSLPEIPWWQLRPREEREDGPSWRMLKGEGTNGPPGREDLISLVTVSPEVTNGTFSPRFWSGRHSRCGESFVYVQVAADGPPSGARLDRREQIEDALDEALIPRKLGAVISSATGVRWDYIDLAVTDLHAAAEVAVKAMRAAEVDGPAWIRCHDADWTSEWKGVWDDETPPPTNQQ